MMRTWMWALLGGWMSVAAGFAAVASADPSLLIRGPYLGQKPPAMTAEVFAPGLVSTGSFEHSRLEISKDGTALYWVVQPSRRRQFIWTTRRGADGNWSEPVALPISDGAEALPFLSSPVLAPDGRTLYFFCFDLVTNEQTLYAVDLEKPQWNDPVSV